jgi:hypothetical protein
MRKGSFAPPEACRHADASHVSHRTISLHKQVFHATVSSFV